MFGAIVLLQLCKKVLPYKWLIPLVIRVFSLFFLRRTPLDLWNDNQNQQYFYKITKQKFYSTYIHFNTAIVLICIRMTNIQHAILNVYPVLLRPLLFLSSLNIFPEFSVWAGTSLHNLFPTDPLPMFETWSLARCLLPLCVERCTPGLLPVFLAYPIGMTCWLSCCSQAHNMKSPSCSLATSK